MAVEKFKPIIFADIIEREFRKELVFGNLFEDMSAKIATEGKTINLLSHGVITVKDYAGNIVSEEGTDFEQPVHIDKKKYFSVKVDDVDAAQATGELITMFGNSGAYELAATVDTTIAGLAKKAEKVVVAGANIAHSILDLAVALDEANVPTSGRWLVISPAVRAELIKAIPTISVGENTFGVAQSNYVGTWGGFEIYVSNNVAKEAITGAHLCMAGVRQSGMVALQIEKVRAMVLENQFGEKVEGLTVFGCDVRETGEEGSGVSNKVAVLKYTPAEAVVRKTEKK